MEIMNFNLFYLFLDKQTEKISFQISNEGQKIHKEWDPNILS